MANPLEIYQYAKKGVDEGRLRAINRLAGQTLTAPDSAQRDASMRALNGVDPMAGYKVQQQLQQDAQATQDRQQKAAAGLASAWLSTANAPPEQRQHFYDTFIAPQSRAAGLQLPDQYDPVSLDQTAKAHLAMLQRGPSAQPYTLAPGARRYDSNNALVAEAPLQEKPQYDAARGGFVKMAPDGTPVFTPVPGIEPKPDTSQMITPYQQAQLGLSRERLALDSENRRDVAATKQAALDMRNNQVHQAAMARYNEAVGSAQSLSDAIDKLQTSKGYEQLGTLIGGGLSKLPYTRATDAQAQLDNIAGQVALTTMARLKALSPQGASGFGALSEKELELLKSSIASLKPGISHDELNASLRTIKKMADKAASMPPPQIGVSAPAKTPASTATSTAGAKYRHVWGD
ncbi:hypothetical protein [Xylella fastidiosa]|uniref:hypothetical protein n=2 Tax=Xylella fastidiosa TaxID=2371 RepID=UPI000499C150|nr:hypothetical protein [Xylella fastidiosa]AIC13741.1 hypothetical protein P303_05120 [Xylella fastidiosa MUL0034]AIC13993.1 hypothetical protein P303_09425 [Xylella fastidiosa MUL0034]